MKKVPMRMCIITKEKLPKKDLIRIVKINEKDITIDLTGKMNGHGVYLKNDQEVFKKAQKGKILEKLLQISIPDNLYEELYKLNK